MIPCHMCVSLTTYLIVRNSYLEEHFTPLEHFVDAVVQNIKIL